MGMPCPPGFLSASWPCFDCPAAFFPAGFSCATARDAHNVKVIKVANILQSDFMEMLLLGSNPVFKHIEKMNIGTLESAEYSHSLAVFNCRTANLRCSNFATLRPGLSSAEAMPRGLLFGAAAAPARAG